MDCKVIQETLSNEDYQEMWDMGTRDPMTVETALVRSLILKLPQKYRDIYNHCIIAQGTQTGIGKELGHSQTHINYTLDRITEYLKYHVHWLEVKDQHHLVGTGDRSERIRTYNFPQNRVTEHRIPITVHNLPSVMDGEITEVLEALAAHDQAERLRQEVEA